MIVISHPCGLLPSSAVRRHIFRTSVPILATPFVPPPAWTTLWGAYREGLEREVGVGEDCGPPPAVPDSMSGPVGSFLLSLCIAATRYLEGEGALA